MTTALLLCLLASPSFEAREAAERGLVSLAPRDALAALEATDDPEARQRLTRLYRRAVRDGLDDLLPPGATYWPDCDSMGWPSWDEDDPASVCGFPPEWRRLMWVPVEWSTPAAWPTFCEHRVHTKAAVERFLVRVGNTEEARDRCKTVLAKACKREAIQPQPQVWWGLLVSRPEALRFDRTRPTR